MSGIHADHRNIAGAEIGEQRAVVVRRLVIVLDEAGADHHGGLVEGCETDVEAVEGAEIAVGSEMVHRIGRPSPR